ncbi:MAG: hypothetical protein HYY49_10460 [Ignavibacteriales bacterium]|nr:hypothetical protein [Ignavibacteriales bacterium]
MKTAPEVHDLKLILILTLFFSNCDVTTPREVVPFEKGLWSGSFTFTAYVGPITKTQSGIVSFVFGDSTYTYSGVMQFSADSDTTTPVAPFEIQGGGIYQRKDGLVTFVENENKFGAWLPNLNLSGEYIYRYGSDVLTITREAPSRTSVLILRKQTE